MLENDDTLFLSQICVTEDQVLVRLLDRQVECFNEGLENFVDRVRLSQVYVICSVLRRLEVMLNCVTDGFGDGWHPADTRWTAYYEPFVVRFEETEDFLNFILAWEIEFSVVLNALDLVEALLVYFRLAVL